MYTDPADIFTKKNVRMLKACTGIGSIDTWTAIFFLLSKSEHDNEAWDRTFVADGGGSVFFYAKRLPYDGADRGVTVGISGWTTANSGNDSWGDFHALAALYKRMGGIDLRRRALGLTTNEQKARKFCRAIRELQGDKADLFVRAQIKNLCKPTGYIYEAMEALEHAGLPHPKALTVAVVIDTLINQGLGGRWCAKRWLEEHPCTDLDERKLLADFLAWKRVAATKNHHNSPPSNGEKRSDMFRTLLEKPCLDLTRAACEQAVKWKML